MPETALPARRRRRTGVVLVAAFALLVFAGLSALLARGLSGAGAERSAVLAVLEAQARGDGAAVLARLPACRREPACARITAERARALRRPGRVQILAYAPTTRFALTRTTGTARVAWRAGDSLPVVQCVKARRDGPVTGAGVELLAISAPIAHDGSCS
jgi:hypothetical protein